MCQCCCCVTADVTARIETVSFSSAAYGEILFYDFAGQSYHGPNQPFLEAILSKPDVSVIILLLFVNCNIYLPHHCVGAFKYLQCLHVHVLYTYTSQYMAMILFTCLCYTYKCVST